MIQINLFAKQRCRCREQPWMSRGEDRGGVNYEIGIDIYTLLPIK